MKKKWFRLDNAALIFPAVMKKGWNNMFRVSATLKDEIEVACLKKACDDLHPRFPTFYVRLRTGFFWSYLEEMSEQVTCKPEYAYPLTHMTGRELKKSCMRVLYFGNRIAVEFFHSITDGTGGMFFLKNLVARYIEIRYGVSVPIEGDILSLAEKPRPEESQDAYLLHSGNRAKGLVERKAYRLRGEWENGRFQHLTTGILPTQQLLETAHQYHVTVSVFLSAVMAEAVQKIQEKERPYGHYNPINITIPVNLRRLYGSKTLRNFVLTVSVGFDPQTGTYTLPEICQQVKNELAYEAIPQRMASRIAANVAPTKMLLMRIMPWSIKKPVMRLVYALRGENRGCLNVSNLGNVMVPSVMEAYVERFEFIVGVQATYPNNCSVSSFKGKTYINMIRACRSSELERLFFSRLVDLGIPVEIESNQRENDC